MKNTVPQHASHLLLCWQLAILDDAAPDSRSAVLSANAGGSASITVPEAGAPDEESDTE